MTLMKGLMVVCVLSRASMSLIAGWRSFGGWGGYCFNPLFSSGGIRVRIVNMLTCS